MHLMENLITSQQNLKLEQILNDQKVSIRNQKQIVRRFSCFNEWIDNIFNHVQNSKL